MYDRDKKRIDSIMVKKEEREIKYSIKFLFMNRWRNRYNRSNFKYRVERGEREIKRYIEVRKSYVYASIVEA